MLINEIFVSYQGEGRYTGKKTLFIRLQGCNLRCVWCDTPDALSKDGGSEVVNDELVKMINTSEVNNIVFTGGEPLLQYKELLCVIRKLDSEIRYGNPTIEVETNGLYSPGDLIYQPVHFTIGMKYNQTENKFFQKYDETLPEFEKSIFHPDYKFVVNPLHDKPLAKIYDFYYNSNIPADRIWLVPAAINKDDIMKKTSLLMNMEHPFNVSARNQFLFA